MWWMNQSVCLSIYLSAFLSACLSICLSACLSICLSVYLLIDMSVCLPICLPVCLLSVCLSACLSTCDLSACLYVWLSARLPICLPRGRPSVRSSVHRIKRRRELLKAVYTSKSQFIIWCHLPRNSDEWGNTNWRSIGSGSVREVTRDSSLRVITFSTAKQLRKSTKDLVQSVFIHVFQQTKALCRWLGL